MKGYNGSMIYIVTAAFDYEGLSELFVFQDEKAARAKYTEVCAKNEYWRVDLQSTEFGADIHSARLIETRVPK